MAGKGTPTTEERLTLCSQLSELSQVPPWIERLASQHAIPGETQFAMDLCLEEVLSNIIRHGYSGQTDRPMTVRFTTPRKGYFVFVIEDEAPFFNPLTAPELPAIGAIEDTRVGGQGIRLVRRFANQIEYQATPTGNRLTIGFCTEDSVITKD
jgi:serine/threonine-protein kinase RsbW